MDTKSSLVLPHQTCQCLTLAEIELATNNFDEGLVIGCGGFGKVYKSLTSFGSASEVAIKRLDPTSNQGASEFEAEVKILQNIRHGNLVPLIGYCNEGNEMVLAYEFMPNGTLEDHLHKDYTELSWLQLLKICIGAARGLDYLHTGTSSQLGVIHRDVKTSNILLDANLAAKISDFGLAKVGKINQTQTFVKTGVKGTFGYMDPDYYYSGKLTRKSDVYAFGVVLLEVLTGKQAVDPSLEESLVVWAKHHIKKGKHDDIIDHSLMEQTSKKLLKEFASIALKCLQLQPKQRLTMSEVVVKLESILSQERKNADSGVDEGRIIDKVRYFFTTKPEWMLDPAVGSFEIGAYNIESPKMQNIFESKNLRNYTYAELESATNSFQQKEYSETSNELIYKGWVDEKTYAPSECGVGMEIYVTNRHVGTCELDLKYEEYNCINLVKLLGYCLNEQVLFCVYELVPDATLEKLLFEDSGITSISWIARLKVALGAAQGLSFLHQRNHPAYKRFKATNILVDSDYKARLSDYEVVTPERISFETLKLGGYINAGASAHRDDLGMKREIYDFGLVLLEILTGVKMDDENKADGKQSLLEWAIPLLEDEANLRMIMDRKLQANKILPKGAFKLALLVSSCLQPIKHNRPSMEEIFQALYLCCQEDNNKIHFIDEDYSSYMSRYM